ALGMRGTCSPGFRLVAHGPQAQIVPGSFADSSAQNIVHYSHILWSSLLWSIAADAVARAGEFVRAAARRNPGAVPPGALRLADVSARLQSMRQHWLSLATEFDELAALGAAGMQELLSIRWGLRGDTP